MVLEHSPYGVWEIREQGQEPLEAIELNRQVFDGERAYGAS